MNKPWNDGVLGTQVRPIIELDDEVICVEAGPGTGKTFGLVRRVQRILHPDGLNVPGDQVLVVAFNRVIAKQLRSDIQKCLSRSDHNGTPKIETIHAMCLKVIGDETRILLPHEEEAMIYDILRDYPALQARFDFKGAEQALRDHEAKHIIDVALWQAVKSWTLKHRAELISELPSLLLDKMRGGDHDDLSYRHVIVDEFQDLTPGEHQLFLMLTKTGGTFLALGDPRQSIYSFRGNDREGLAKVDSLVSDSGRTVNRVEMTECVRCPAKVVSAANKLMSLYTSSAMTAQSTVDANTHVVVWNSLNAETEGMAKAIVENIRENPSDDHLVMVSRRYIGYELRKQIARIEPNLSIDLSFSESLLETWAVREAFIFFCLLADPDAPTWRSWLGYKTSNDGKEFNAAKRNADSYLKILSRFADKITEENVREIAEAEAQPSGAGGGIIWERSKRFFALKEGLTWDGTDPIQLLQEIFNFSKWGNESHTNRETAEYDMSLALKKVTSIYEELKENEPELSVEGYLKNVAQTLRYQIATRETLDNDDSCDLRISTLWGAKGITAHHVYVLGLCNESIPGEKGDEYHGTEAEFVEEQRRLFYVSLTRSKKTLVLSRSKSISATQAKQLGLPARGNGHIQTLTRSRFLSDIDEDIPAFKRGHEWGGVI